MMNRPSLDSVLHKGHMNESSLPHSRATNTSAMVVFSDLDGTLLDNWNYSFDAAQEALDRLQDRSIPVVLVSSKTRAEMEPLRAQLHNEHPFIVENGGAVVVPALYFRFAPSKAIESGPYHIIELGTRYSHLRKVLKELERALGVELRGYGDMSVEEVARETGLSLQAAELAKQRDYDEPFVVMGRGCDEAALAKAIAAQGLRWTKGDRYHHLMGDQDKGRAVHALIQCYRKNLPRQDMPFTTVALGNSLNDFEMLAAVDIPILVQQADGSYAKGMELPQLIRAPSPGPAGWNHAVLSVLQGS